MPTKFSYQQIKSGIPGAKANTSLGCLLSMQFDRGVNPIVKAKLNDWVDAVRNSLDADYDTTLGEIFQLSVRGENAEFYLP